MYLPDLSFGKRKGLLPHWLVFIKQLHFRFQVVQILLFLLPPTYRLLANLFTGFVQDKME